MSIKPLVDRIAARFGFVRSARPVREMVVFNNAADARLAGFRGALHPLLPDTVAWWPGLGMKGLLCRPIQRVTISADMARWHRTDEGLLRSILRRRQMVFGDDAVWIEV